MSIDTGGVVSDSVFTEVPLRVLNIMTQRELRRGWPPSWERYSCTSRQIVDIISEFIDNTAAEMKHCGGRATIEIDICGDWTGRLNLNTARLRIRDNATGMRLDRLEKCLAMGELSSDVSTSLHEHGMGMKTALISLCAAASSLKYIVTKRAESEVGYRFTYSDPTDPSRPFGEIPVLADTTVFARHEHGTEFFVEGLASSSGIYRQRAHFAQYFIQPLAFKYSRLLSGNNMHNNRLQIIVRLCDRDGKLLDNKAEWNIDPISQRYRNGARPHIDQLSLSGSGGDEETARPWAAYLDFGRAAQEDEYKNAGLSAPGQKHPCHPYNRKIHVVMHDRVVTSLSIDAFGGRSDSNVWVPYTGVITLLSGFKTTHEKDGVVPDANWQELVAEVYKRINPLISKWAAEDQQNRLTESELRDEYARRLRLTHPGALEQPEVKTEYPVASCGGYIDIFYLASQDAKTGTVIEMKAAAADGLDVFQTFYYMFMCDEANKKYGRLVAESFADGAADTAARLKKELDITIELRTLADEALDNIHPRD